MLVIQLIKMLSSRKSQGKLIKGRIKLLNKINYIEDMDEKHKRWKSQTINSVTSRKGNSVQDVSIDEISHLLHQHNQKNTNTSYNLVNEYLENPGKINPIKSTSLTSVSTESKPINRSRGKLEPNSSFIINSGIVSLHKKIAFKSFDKRRAGTNLERREGNIDDPLSYVRASSAWNKNNSDKVSAKKSTRTTKTGSNSKSKKIRQTQNWISFAKVNATNAIWRIMKSKIR